MTAVVLALIVGCIDGLERGLAEPADTQFAAGPTHLMEAVNSQIRIYDRNTLAAVATLAPDDLVGCDGHGTIPSTFKFDPRLKFDALSGRWILIYVQGAQDVDFGAYCIGVSATSNPLGVWRKYELAVDDPGTTFPDFPEIGITTDKVFFISDIRTQGGDALVGQDLLIFNKAELLAGGLQHILRYPPGAMPEPNVFMRPVQFLSPGTTAFLVGHRWDVGSATSLKVWQIIGVPGQCCSMIRTDSLGLENGRNDPPQPVQKGSTTPIDVRVGKRILQAVAQNGRLWTTAMTGCTPDGDTSQRSCMSFIELRIDQSAFNAPTKRQGFRVGTPHDYYYYPAMSLDSAGNMLAAFNRSSSSEFVSVYASGHIASGALQNFAAPSLVKAGTVSYGPLNSMVAQRWGDYSGAAKDPVTGFVVFGAMYPRAFNKWGTWLFVTNANL